jgi:hypothetical protein
MSRRTPVNRNVFGSSIVIAACAIVSLSAWGVVGSDTLTAETESLRAPLAAETVGSARGPSRLHYCG